VILPSLVEIVPLSGAVQAQISVPGSKSITNRALFLAAVASATTTLKGALWSDDTEVMVKCLERLGVRVSVAEDPDESANRTITVIGTGAPLPENLNKK